MEKLKTIIVDDESPGRENLASIVNVYLPDLRVTGMTGDVETAYKMICENQPELVFLDMELGDGTGLDLLSRFDVPDFYTIFVTAYDQYAVKAFRAQAIDYILKPIDIDELKEAVQKVKMQIHLKNGINENKIQSPEQDGEITFDAGFLKISTVDGLEMVSIQDIVFLKSINYYTKIVLINNKSYIITKTLKEHEKLLQNYSFFRIHHSFIININYLKSVEIKEKNIAIMQNGMEISVSRRRKDKFLELVSVYKTNI